MSIASNISVIQERIVAAARRAGRGVETITLMAVSKTQPPERVREAYETGLRVFGENRVQEFSGKLETLRELRDAEWHMIGHLQTNKTGKAAELFTAVDSVDSVKLAEKLNTSARPLGKKLRVLIELNVGGEFRPATGPGPLSKLSESEQDRNTYKNIPCGVALLA